MLKIGQIVVNRSLARHVAVRFVDLCWRSWQWSKPEIDGLHFTDQLDHKVIHYKPFNNFWLNSCFWFRNELFSKLYYAPVHFTLVFPGKIQHYES